MYITKIFSWFFVWWLPYVIQEIRTYAHIKEIFGKKFLLNITLLLSFVESLQSHKETVSCYISTLVWSCRRNTISGKSFSSLWFSWENLSRFTTFWRQVPAPISIGAKFCMENPFIYGTYKLWLYICIKINMFPGIIIIIIAICFLIFRTMIGIC